MTNIIKGFRSRWIARKVLGPKHVSYKQMREVFDFSYSNAEKEQLSESMPSRKGAYYELKKGGSLLLPKPPEKFLLPPEKFSFWSVILEDARYSSIPLLNIRINDPSLVSQGKRGDVKSLFDSITIEDAGWMIIGTEIIEDTNKQGLKRLLKNIPNDRRIPNAAELAYAILVYFKVNKIRLFEYSNKPVSSGRIICTSSTYGVNNIFIEHLKDRLMIHILPIDDPIVANAGVVHVYKHIPK